MRALVQRVTRAQVDIEGVTVGSIDAGQRAQVTAFLRGMIDRDDPDKVLQTILQAPRTGAKL